MELRSQIKTVASNKWLLALVVLLHSVWSLGALHVPLLRIMMTVGGGSFAQGLYLVALVNRGGWV